MKVKFYTITDFEAMTKEEISAIITSEENGFRFGIAVPSARHYIDLAEYYLEASYVAETLYKLCKCKVISTKPKSGYDYSELELQITPVDKDVLAEFIFTYSGYETGEDEASKDEFINNYENYRLALGSAKLHHPELIDSYYANLMAAYNEIAGSYNHRFDFYDNYFRNAPEHQYGYWKSAESSGTENIFYVSREAWIIPHDANISKVLRDFGGLKNLILIESEFFVVGQSCFLMSDSQIVYFPFGAYLRAKNCAEMALTDSFEPVAEYDWMNHLLDGSREQKALRGRSLKLISEGKLLKLAEPLTSEFSHRFYVSEFGDNIIITDQQYCYVFWNCSKLSNHDLLQLNEVVARIFNTSAFLAGILVEIKCPWEVLNDEQFEELCYDIIYYNSKFDNSTIKKMGNTRSRDGGRDIVVYTTARPGYEPEKYIFQCKLVTKSKSLNTSNMGSVSDVIDQYDARGYGIMTSTVIDASLHDRLEGIAKSRGIKAESFSVYELERTLALHPNLRRRYFSTST